MKQHITIEQLKELSRKGKKRLKKWWKPTSGDAFGDPKTGVYCESYADWMIINGFWPKNHLKGKFPLLSIGQMIEFLEETNKEWRGISLSHQPGGELGFPNWIIIPNYSTKPFPKEVWRNKELCDALWEAVKEVLEK